MRSIREQGDAKSDLSSHFPLQKKGTRVEASQQDSINSQTSMPAFARPRGVPKRKPSRTDTIRTIKLRTVRIFSSRYPGAAKEFSNLGTSSLQKLAYYVIVSRGFAKRWTRRGAVIMNGETSAFEENASKLLKKIEKNATDGTKNGIRFGRTAFDIKHGTSRK